MTATHNALLGALSRHSHFSEFSEPLEVRGNILTPAQRRALALLNLTDDFLAQTPSGVLTRQAGLSLAETFNSYQVRAGNRVRTTIEIDLTGLNSSTTDLDVIGNSTGGVAYLARAVPADIGVIVTGRMSCIETPAGGVTDIDLYSATVGTAVFDDLITDLTETAHVTAGGAWAAGESFVFINGAAVTPNNYFYLTGGAAGTAATYTAGKFVIELDGYLSF